MPFENERLRKKSVQSGSTKILVNSRDAGFIKNELSPFDRVETPYDDTLENGLLKTRYGDHTDDEVIGQENFSKIKKGLSNIMRAKRQQVLLERDLKI